MKLQKKLTKKVRSLMQSDMLASVAIASILLNVFFLAGFFLFTTTNKLDESVYNVAYNNLCVGNYEQNLEKRIEVSEGDELAEAKFEIICGEGAFNRYYENAVEAYINDQL